MPELKLLKRHYLAIIKPAMELGKTLDVGINPSPTALFDVRTGAINIWCTPDDHPASPEWSEIKMTPGAFCKPAEYVAMMTWERDTHDLITKIQITTDAFVLSDQLPERFVNSRRFADKDHEHICDRQCDLEWAKSKTHWLFKQIEIDLKKLRIPVVTCANE